METPDTIAEREIFAAAAALPPEERAAFLDVACEARPQVRENVEAWLKAHGECGFMRPEEEDRLNPERPGERIGNFTLVEKIGEGGFGVVWVAEQEQPVKRRVALKIVKLGMDTKEVIARFGQERQALALMDHPHIAKVFDAGATERGRPYFVMELVQGIKITDYCDQVNLTTGGRLELFIQVCNAVQHAHQKGIIHRDLKPSNILVALHDGVAVPKIIDFGVAKAIRHQESGELSINTQFQQMIGTPLYMSPEQADGGLDVDTRSDIYSLGTLLYELLTGRTPFDPRELIRKGHEEIRRAIREQEPKTPSMFLKSMDEEMRVDVARRRQGNPAKLAKTIRRDVDCIVMKALEKDRSRRYQTANGLAQDVRRFLTGEPVAAAVPSVAYRFGKFARRNKAVIGMATLIATILVVATVFSLWKANVAAKAEEKAIAKASAERLAREEAEAIFTVLTEVFQSANPNRAGRTASVSETLAAAVRKLDALDLQPARQLHLQATLGWTYHVLELDREAIPLLEAVRDRCVQTFGVESRESMRAVQNLARSYFAVHRQAEAVQMHQQVLAFHRKSSGPDHPDTLGAMVDLGNSYRMGDQWEKSLQLWNEVLDTLRTKTSGPEYRHTLAALADVARAMGENGRWTEATEMHEQLLTLSRTLNGPEHSDTIFQMAWLANAYINTSRYEEALPMQEEAYRLFRKTQGPEHPDTLHAMRRLVNCYWYLARKDDVLKLQEESLELHRKVLGLDHIDTVTEAASLASTYNERGRLDDAFKVLEEALASSRGIYGSDNHITMRWAEKLADYYSRGGRLDDAVKLLAEVVKFSRKQWGDRNSNTYYQFRTMAEYLERANHWDEALLWRDEFSARKGDNDFEWVRITALQVWFGKGADHQATCERLLRSRLASLPVTAYRVAKACCLRPSSDSALLESSLESARSSVGLGEESEDMPDHQLVLGMVEYRRGNYPAADVALTTARQSGKDNRHISGTAGFFHAMSLFQQGKTEEARPIFAATMTGMRPLPSDERRPFDDGADADDLVVWLAYKEARQLLER